MILKIDYETEKDLIDFVKNYLPDLLRDGITEGCFHGCDWSIKEN